jgi:MSHA pilin protein MshD
MIRQQATAIASAYLEEIMQRPFSGTAGVKARGAYDNVNDYLNLPDATVRDQQGLAIPGLGQYSVSVQVAAGTMPVVPSADTRLITVTVTHSTGVTVRLSGYKTNHPPL